MENKPPAKAGSPISKKLAKELVKNFKKNFEVKNNSTYYSLDTFQRLMSIPGCVGIRIYPGLEEGTFTPVLVAVDVNGNNIYHDPRVSSSLAAKDDDPSAIEERGAACPPFCPTDDL